MRNGREEGGRKWAFYEKPGESKARGKSFDAATITVSIKTVTLAEKIPTTKTRTTIYNRIAMEQAEKKKKKKKQEGTVRNKGAEAP